MMNSVVSEQITSAAIGPVQAYRNMAVFPLTIPRDLDPEFLTLGEALGRELMQVREVSEGGSVPDLLVSNNSDSRVLLLDGEEVSGAKQNRVLNTTILIGARSTIKIPVSCTEQGRWSYDSPEFQDSDVVMHKKLRALKMKSVSENLKSSHLYSSNQSEVWGGISELQAKTASHSPTSAMKHVHTTQRDRLEDYLKAFPKGSGQAGVIVFINGRAEGLELLSRPAAYAKLHDRLLRSYALDALVHRPRRQEDEKQEVDQALADSFVEQSLEAQEEKFPSVGLGDDHRYEADSIVGSALVVDTTPVHLAFFRLPGDNGAEGDTQMASLRNRRGYRSSRGRRLG